MIGSTPKNAWKELFVDLHLSGIWEDGKYISDAKPKEHISIILEKYRQLKKDSNFNLKSFFEAHFESTHLPDSGFIPNRSLTLEEHIKSLWPYLTREADPPQEGDSRIPLPFSYVVPGGRFNEIYYWDSYFTMLGLAEHGQWDLIQGMVNNFAYFIEKIGFIPNGNRNYFTSRSQPPFFSFMVELLASTKGKEIWIKYYEALVTEYHWWMDENNGHVVPINKGVLNRYHDQMAEPREEMYGEDVSFLNSLTEPTFTISSMRAACESGWDFSSRWCTDPLDLASIETDNILPIDLNCLLYQLEIFLSKVAELKNNPQASLNYKKAANVRLELIQEYMWDENDNTYYDFNWKNNKPTKRKTLSMAFPLFVSISTADQANKVLTTLRNEFLKDGGMVTSLIASGQQWDYPNGWAPLQWICYKAAENYEDYTFAQEISQRWCALNEKVFQASGKMMEKYNVIDMNLESGGGEYPVQDGFGWSNGVYIAMKSKRPKD